MAQAKQVKKPTKKINKPTKKEPVVKKPATKKPKSRVKPARLINIWDRSGSMSSLALEAMSSYNDLIKQQKKLKAKTTVTTIIFDDQYEVLHDDIDIKDVPMLTGDIYYARGMTAYFDALGKTIKTYLASTKKGVLTILNVMTDGYENASKEFRTSDQVKAVVEEARKLGWEIQFLGANIDSASVGSSMGINFNTTTNFDPTSKGLKDAGMTMAYASSYARGGVSLSADVLNVDKTVNMTKLYEKIKKDEGSVEDKEKTA